MTLNKQQKDCVEAIYGNILILSGAGSGKTRVIINRFLKYIEIGTDSKDILCVTFTNKAANEIIERLKSNNINPVGLWVGTIHKVCFQILQKYGDLNKNMSIIDQNDQFTIANKLNITEFLKNIQSFKDQMPTEETPEFKTAYTKYQNFIEENNLMDFSEIILKTFTLLLDKPSLCEHLKNKFKFLMVDEYQDTSKIQNDLIKLISNNNLCCVGDDDQSIYSWRGAYIDNILNFHKDFKNVKVFKLEQNYRSNKNILGVATHVISQNFNRLDKNLFSETTGPKVNIISTKYEGDFIARKICELPSNTTTAILVRNSKNITEIEASLIKFHVDYQILHKTNFLDRLEIKAAISYLKGIFLGDVISLESILNTPKRGLGPKKIEKIFAQTQNGLSFLSALKEIGQGNLADNISRWRILEYKKPSEIFEIIWKESGCADLFKERWQNVQSFMKKMDDFNNVEEFLNNFFSLTDDNNNTPVVIMTIHSSKGLEFDNVFIPHFIEGTLPSYKSISENNIEEERRVAYVGITRAKNQLFLSYNLNQGFAKSVVFGPSRFLYNIPKEFINYQIL